MTMSAKYLCSALLACAVLLAACQPSAPAASKTAATVQVVTKESADAAKGSRAVPGPVKAFELFCFANQSDYSRVVATAKAMKLKSLPNEMMAVLGPQVGSGQGFVLVNSKKKGKVMLVGASDRNACSIYAQGWEVQRIKASMLENYHLKLAFQDDTGLQIQEMYIPNGTKGTVGEGDKFGVIGLAYTKDVPSKDITISFVPPDVARKLF